LLNTQPFSFDSDQIDDDNKIDRSHIVDPFEPSPGIINKLPRDLPWPPFKSDNPYRRVIVELEAEPTSLVRASFLDNGFAGAELGERVTDHYLGLVAEHKVFKNRLQVVAPDHEVLWDYYNVYNGLGLVIHEKYVPMIDALPGVLSVSYDKQGKGALSDSVKIINADATWQKTNATGASLNGEGVVVAVLDTGIDYNHKDLGGDFGPGYKVIGGYDFVNDDADPMDDNYHGTMVSGIIAASGTVKGVAPNASLLAYKVSDETDNAMITDTVAGLDRALDPDGVPATDDAADILCISLSWFGTPYDAISKAVNNAFAAGSLPVVAGGNNGPDLMTTRSPGSAYGALTLGATTKADEIASISSRGPVGFGHIKPDIVAPGIDIFTTYLGNSYGTLTGTSASAPQAVGAAALLKQLHPNWTAPEIKDALINNAFDLGEDAVTQGAGRLDVLSAVEAKLRASPGVLAFEKETNGIWDETTSEILTFNNSHGFQVDCTIEIECYYSADKELWEVEKPVQVFNYIQPSNSAFSVPAMGTKDITFTLNIQGAAEQGYFWGSIEIKSANDNLTVPFGFRNIDITTDKGEWVISTDTDLSNQQFRAKNLTVTNDALLTLDNVTIFIDSTKNGQSLIDIIEGSSIEMNYCIIAPYNASVYFNFSMYGKGTIRNSHLSGMWGVYRSPYPGGINIYADDSEVTNSTIFRCYTNGVFSAETSGVLVADNYIHHNGGEGVLVWKATDLKILRNNCSQNWWDGVGITGGDAVISDNSIHFNSYDGIWVNNSSPLIANNVVTGSGYWMKHQDAAGIKFQRGSSPVMENNTFSGNKYYGFYINASSPIVMNTSVDDSHTKDILIVPFKGNHCEPFFINSTYNSISIPLNDPDSKITRQWFMQVIVKDDTGRAVPGATVKLIDRNQNLVKLQVTDADGSTKRFIATQYIRTLSKTD
jgi:parallel beta-helix repeat protein